MTKRNEVGLQRHDMYGQRHMGNEWPTQPLKGWWPTDEDMACFPATC
jgi:hypothetical protein